MKKGPKQDVKKTAGDEVYFSLASTMTPELENLLGKIEYDIQRGENVSQVIASKKELKDYFVFVR